MCSKLLKRKVCQYCGKEYFHWNGKSKYCEGPHYPEIIDAPCDVFQLKEEYKRCEE